jgi:hypothetical protein
MNNADTKSNEGDGALTQITSAIEHRLVGIPVLQAMKICCIKLIMTGVGCWT